MEREVIKSFLVSLGFAIDDVGARKFSTLLDGVDSKAKKVSAAVAGITVAAEVMVTAFAHSMEKLYYASQRTGQAAENLQGYAYAASQIGLTAEQVQGAVESMALALKTNPGLKGLLAQMGIDPNSKNLLAEFITKLKLLPDYIAADIGSQFGFDPQTLLQLKQFLPEFLAAQQRRIELNRELGISAAEAAAASREYMNTLRDIWAELGVVKDKIAIELLPAFRTTAIVVRELIGDMVAGRDDILPFGKTAQAISDIMWGLGKAIGYVSDQLQELKSKDFKVEGDSILGKAWNFYRDTVRSIWGMKSDSEKGVDKMLEGSDLDGRRSRGRIGGAGGDTGGAPGGRSTRGANGLFAGLEQAFGLPAGLLDRVWSAESGRGRNMVGKKTKSGERALGHFQFMGDTAAEYGVENPYNLESSAKGAAAYLGVLLRTYEGDINKALAAWNWGPGNLNRKGLGAAPQETRDFIEKVNPSSGAGVTIHQETNISVNGATDPNGTASAVGREQRGVNGDIVRNLAGVMQ